MKPSEFEEWRDSYFKTRWEREEPFGYDHPETIEFIKDMMTASMDWQFRRENSQADKLAKSLDECAHIIKGAFGNTHPSYVDAMKVLRRYLDE